jgi:hypothetical protein
MVENDFHTLRDYPKALSIGRYFRSIYPNDFSIDDCQAWFKYHATTKSGSIFIVVGRFGGIEMKRFFRMFRKRRGLRLTLFSHITL